MQLRALTQPLAVGTNGLIACRPMPRQLDRRGVPEVAPFSNVIKHITQRPRPAWKERAVEHVVVNVDENKLLRVVQNLVGNAVEAFKGCGGRVELTAWVNESGVNIKIRDNGPGIPDAIKDRVFEAFVTYVKHSGTGLGTAIAKSIIDAHGGQISFESSCQEGTTFYINLPL